MSISCPNPKCYFPNSAVERKDGSWKCKKCGYVARKHTHRWRVVSYGTGHIGEFCAVRGCSARREREPTKIEAAYIKKQMRTMWSPKPEDNVHLVWHDFTKRFLGTKKDPYAFKDSGYALMKKLDKWAARFPNDVHNLGCDDGAHMGSTLLLIEHKARHHWMGVTVVVVPQNGDGPVQFFLYPGHVDGLMAALRIVQKRTREGKHAARKHEAIERETRPW